MQIFLILLACGFVASLMFAYSHYHWLIRLLCIVIALSVSLIGFIIINSYKGSPYYISRVPPDIIVYGQIIDLNNNTIYILFRETQKKEEARYVYTDYYMPLHKVLAEGARSSNGQPFRITTTKKDNGEGKGVNQKGQGGLSVYEYEHEAVPLPSAILPDK